MSHFSILVIVPGVVTTAEEATPLLERALAPFSEHLEVPEYQRECWCIGLKARQDTRKKEEEHFGGTFEEMVRKPFWAEVDRIVEEVGGYDPESFESRESFAVRHGMVPWVEFSREWVEWGDEYLENHPNRMDPDPTCGCWTEELIETVREKNPSELPEGVQPGDLLPDDAGGCGGTGTYLSTYNPEGKWDWYVIGGGWTGLLSDYDPRKDPLNQETCYICKGTGLRTDHIGEMSRALDPEYTCNGCDGKGTRLKWRLRNREDLDILPMSQVQEWFQKGPSQYRTFALLTPVGEWVERGDMGCWGVASNEKDSGVWQAEYGEIIARYVGDEPYTGIVVDCHT